MFWFKKKKEKAAEIVPTNTSIEEEMGLKDYVSFDSVKAHLVDILEENRRLKQEEKDKKDRVYKEQQGVTVLATEKPIFEAALKVHGLLHG